MKRLAPVAAVLLTAACSAGADPTTEQGEEFEGIWRIFLVIAIAVVLLIWGLVVWCVVRYRRRPDDEDHLPNQGGDRPRLELGLMLGPLVVVIALFALSVVVELRITEVDEDPDLVVEVEGYRWDWRFTYVDAGVVVTPSPDDRPVLVLPVGRTIRFELRSDDVVHSFWVPEFGTKQDLIPRVDNHIDIDITEPGTWTGRSAEYCGLDHASMDFEVRAIPADEFDAWLAEQADMTLLAPRPEVEDAAPHRSATGLLAWLTSTDHKRIGISYMVTAFGFYLLGGLLAMGMRAELAEPGQQVVGRDTYNEMFTMHGSIMLLLFAGPFAFGLANYLVPLQVGARDMAFPRLNLLSYWVFLGGGLVMCSGFLTADGAADFGWFAYAPLSDSTYTPGLGGDLWIAGVLLTGMSGVLTAVNIVTTVLTMRAKGMRMFRMPIFTWNMLATSILVLLAFPVLSSAGAMLFADRHLGGAIFDQDHGGVPILWQHLFWFFGHPEVYVLALPYFGVVTEIFAVFSRRPVFGYRGLVLATLSISALSMSVWAHHMFATGDIVLPFFGATTMLIAVPTGVKFFNWIGTMWGGQLAFKTPMLFAIGFLLVFVIGGVTGVMLASPGIDFQVTDSYFVVAHFHYVLFGGSVFALFGGIYFWFPKFSGRRLTEGWGKVHFWMTFVGFNLTFFVQHVLGLDGMPRRVADYTDADGFTTLNTVSTVGAFLLGASTLPFLWNVWRTLRRPPDLDADDPWDGHTLEWVTPSPPPEGNFVDPLPPIRSERPAWDAKHGEEIPRVTNLEHPDAVDSTEETVVEEAAETSVGSRIFLALTAFFVVLTVIYWFSSDHEWAGTALLALSGGLSALTGGFLALLDRRGGLREELEPEDYQDRDVLFLPHASLRPLWIGAGAVLVAAGLPLGAWLLLPGGVLVAFGLVGLVEEGRRR